LASHGPHHLVVRITEAKPKGHAVDASLVRSFGTCDQDTVDLVERVVFPIAMLSQQLVLHPAAHVIDAAVRDCDDMKRVGHLAGVIGWG
jgi:hypothetical protein